MDQNCVDSKRPPKVSVQQVSAFKGLAPAEQERIDGSAYWSVDGQRLARLRTYLVRKCGWHWIRRTARRVPRT